MNITKDFVKFQSHTSARDKVLRLIQYGSRLRLWQLTYGSSEIRSIGITKLKQLEAALALSRKLFRMGNSLDLAMKALEALRSPHDIMNLVLTFTSHAAKAIWLVMDHVLWLSKVGLVKIDLPLWSKTALRAWLLALVAATLNDILKFEKSQASVQKYKKENGDSATLPNQLQTEVRTVRMTFWRDFSDVLIPLGGLGYVSPGAAALGGVASSLIGMVQEWEKIIKPWKPKSD